MEPFKTFRHKSTGVVADYPAHYADHPVFGYDLEPYELGNDEYEEDKVVIEGHEVPVDQRGYTVAYAFDELKADDLKELLKEKDLPVSGNRDELIARLVEYNEKNED